MQERRQLCFDQAVTHFNMVADAATHSKKEMFVATLWSWQNDLAAYGDVQLLQPGDIVLPDEQDMTDRIALMAAERRLQRVATYRQLQAYSNILHQATGGRLTLDSFRLPANVHARPVQPDDVRVLREGDIQDRAFLYNKATQTSVQMLPDDLVDVPLLVLGLDQGSIGTAGQAYAEEVMQSMVHTKYDKFHRVIRDIKLSFQHSCNGIFLTTVAFVAWAPKQGRAQSSHVSVNQTREDTTCSQSMSSSTSAAAQPADTATLHTIPGRTASMASSSTWELPAIQPPSPRPYYEWKPVEKEYWCRVCEKWATGVHNTSGKHRSWVQSYFPQGLSLIHI